MNPHLRIPGLNSQIDLYFKLDILHTDLSTLPTFLFSSAYIIIIPDDH